MLLISISAHLTYESRIALAFGSFYSDEVKKQVLMIQRSLKDCFWKYSLSLLKPYSLIYKFLPSYYWAWF